ncbi:MAG: hypothetical protein RLY58_485 [Pseudomonadota bacterium]|jgi:fatty acid desaturase
MMNMQLAERAIQRKSRVLSAEEIQEFGRRLDAIRDDVHATLGQKDAEYVYKVRDFVRYTEIASRAMLMFGGWIPPIWLLGTGMLGVSKIVENMELGHNVMHGQFDWLNDTSLNGAKYDWDNTCAGDDWRHSHNFMHHTYTNIVGKDRDVGYGLLRMTEEQPWNFGNLFNLPKTVILGLGFQWFVGVHDLAIADAVYADKPWSEVVQNSKPFLRKAARQVAKDYVFFPVIAGPNALPVLAGNATANLIRNVWSFAIIFCGHFTADAEMFEDNLDKETKGEWYLRQIKGSSNLTGGPILHFMSGNLSHQIEHHLFPDTPANRYIEMSAKVQALCAEYGQHYNSGSFAKQFTEVIERIAIHSVPNPVIRQGRQLKARLQGAFSRLTAKA